MVRGNRDHAAQSMCCRLQARLACAVETTQGAAEQALCCRADTFHNQRFRGILNRGIEIASLSGNAPRGHPIYQRLTPPSPFLDSHSQGRAGIVTTPWQGAS